MSLVYTNFVILLSAPLLSLLLLYINGYTRSKTDYTHSHIFSVLSSRGMMRRVVYMSLRAIYPILFYNTAILVKALISTNFRISDIIWDPWTCIYVAQNLMFAVIVLTLPILGLCFDRKDKNNIYIYWRLYGE